MKGIQIERTGGSDVLEFTDLKMPDPGPGQVLVRAASIGINYADVMVRQGTYIVMPKLPAVLGMEQSGVVEAVGADVKGVEPGRRVIVLAEKCYAEYVVADQGSIFPIPEDVDLDLAAAFPVNYLSAFHMMHTMGNMKPGQTVLVYAAAGGVGTAAAQLGNLAGLTVIGLTSTDEKGAYAREQGCRHVINIETEDVVARVREITGKEGVHLILDSVAGKTFSSNFDMLAPLGQIIWFGMVSGPPKANLTRHLVADFGKGVGVRVFHLWLSVGIPYPELMKESVRTLIQHLKDKKIEPRIFDRIPLAEAARAHELLESRLVTGKLLLKP